MLHRSKPGTVGWYVKFARSQTALTQCRPVGALGLGIKNASGGALAKGRQVYAKIGGQRNFLHGNAEIAGHETS